MYIIGISYEAYSLTHEMYTWFYCASLIMIHAIHLPMLFIGV